MLAGLDSLDYFARVAEAADDGYFQRAIAVGHLGLLYALVAADALEGYRAQGRGRFVGGYAAQHRFRDAARDAEDDARAAHRAERHVDGFWLELVEYDARFLYHLYELLRRYYEVRVGAQLGAELLARSLGLLRGAGHDGDVVVLAR